MLPKVLLADDHVILLGEIRTLLERHFEIVGSANDGRQLLAAAKELRPEAIVLDIGMPVLNGIEAARQIRRDLPETKIIFLTQQSERAYVEEAFRIGASAYVLKQAAASDLETAVQQALQGRYFISSSIDKSEVLNHSEATTNPSTLFRKPLTTRQREILQLVSQHKSVKEIAVVLRASARTIEFQIAGLLDELGTETMEELSQYAIEHGFPGR